MRVRSGLLVLTWVGCGALVSSALAACSSDDSANPAAIESVDSSMLALPGPDDAETEGGGRDSTVADAPEGDSTTADGPTEATGADGPTEATDADGPAEATGRRGGNPGEAGPTQAKAGPTQAKAGRAQASGTDAFCPPEAGTDGGLTTLGVIGALRGDTCRQCAIDNHCDPTTDLPICEDTTGVLRRDHRIRAWRAAPQCSRPSPASCRRTVSRTIR